MCCIDLYMVLCCWKMAAFEFVTTGLMNTNDNKMRGMSRSFVSNTVSSKKIIQDYTLGTAFPQSRKGHTMVYLSNSLYLFGGKLANGTYKNDLWRYVFPDGPWTEIVAPNPPAPRAEHCMVVYNGNIYIYGGWGGTIPTSYSNLTIYNSILGTWSVPVYAGGSVAMTTTYGAASIVVGSTLYLIGGVKAGALITTGIFSCDLSTALLRWQTAGSLTNACYRMSAVVDSAGTFIYFYGGDTSFTVPNCLPNMLRYRLFNGTIVTVNSTPPTGVNGLAGYAMFINGINIFAYGGYTSGGLANNNLYMFNISNLTWSALPVSSPIASSYPRCLCASASNGTTVYIDDGVSAASGATTFYSETWSISLSPSIIATQLPTKQIYVGGPTFTLNGVQFNATLSGLNLTVTLTVSQTAPSGLILTLSGLRLLI